MVAFPPSSCNHRQALGSASGGIQPMRRNRTRALIHPRLVFCCCVEEFSNFFKLNISSLSWNAKNVSDSGHVKAIFIISFGKETSNKCIRSRCHIGRSSVPWTFTPNKDGIYLVFVF